MFRKVAVAVAIGAAMAAPVPGIAAGESDIQKIRDEIQELKDSYDSRILQLEQRVEKAAQPPAVTNAPPPSAPASPNAFNPAISLILGGQFSNLQRDPRTWQIGGFIPGGGEV